VQGTGNRSARCVTHGRGRSPSCPLKTAGSEIRPYLSPKNAIPRQIVSNSLPLRNFHHQFLESTPLGLRHLLRERNFSSGWRLWCNGARQSRRRKPRPRMQWCFEKPVGEHGSFGFAVRALVRPRVRSLRAIPLRRLFTVIRPKAGPGLMPTFKPLASEHESKSV
jgi:hypothetical protein